MANSGAKFMSTNLNKSYGQSSHSNYSSFGGSYGQAAAARGRQGNGGGGGGGMVVLSRPRSSQKTGPKLSVPPPLNLPSLRKEHERFDSSGLGGVAGSSGGPSGGPRPTSSGVGWTKPATFVSQEKDGSVEGPGVEESVDGTSKSNNVYMPPLVRSSGVSGPVSGSSARTFPSPVEKASVLRGEDFPSLQAALPVSSGSTPKQKDGVNQKPKRTLPEVMSYDDRDGYRKSALVDMRPQEKPFHVDGNVPIKNGSEDHSLGNSRMDNRARKQEEYFSSPLPLVRLNPRSDWADDERDTGHKFSDRGTGFSKSENYWDSEFDMPRASVLPHKPVYNQHERWGQRDNEIGKSFSNEVLKVDTHQRDVRTPSREGRQGNSWRTTPFAKDEVVANDGNSVIARTSGLNRDTWKENKYIPPRVGDMPRDGDMTANQDSTFGRRDTVHASEGRQCWGHMTGSFNGRRFERDAHDHYSVEQGSRCRGDGLQNSTMRRSSFSSGGKPTHFSEPVVAMGPDKRTVSKGEMPYEDPYTQAFGSAGFDDSDPFSRGFLGIVKRKKDVKHTDFHDPVRESFEAELERVQKMQELERQRIVEEQERAMEQARREEEERQRLIREEEERRLRLEKEAQEAAWRAEQEQLEAIRQAEEQKIAREEERRRILMEEERRKQAAKEKLLELEARIAKRDAEAGKVDAADAASVVDEKLHAAKEVSSAMDFDNWEESERMVERITTSASFDSCGINRGYEISPSPHLAREGSSSVPDRGKSVNSWRRDVFENGSVSSSPLHNQEFGHYSPRRDALAGGRVIPRKDFYGGAGYMPSRSYVGGGPQDPYIDVFGHQKDLQWNISGGADAYHKNRELDSEFRDNVVEKYGDVGWGQGRNRGNTRPAHMERLYRNIVEDELYSYGRSRYSMRQPRVPPPPSLASVQKTSFRGASEHPGALDNGNHFGYAATKESVRQTGYYGNHDQGLEPLNITDVQQDNPGSENQKLDQVLTPECDSQSSLSVSSPPDSPPHLSHDELDESGDSPLAPSAEDGSMAQVTGNKPTIVNNAGTDTLITGSGSNFVVEDEVWAIENSNELQQQEEYEDEDGYEEEDELREGDDENLDLNQDFEDLHLEEGDSSHMVDNLVLGFDDGVEVRISDDIERNSRSEDRGLGISEASEEILENQGSIESNQVDGQNLRPMVGSSQMSTDSSSGKIHRTEKVFEVSANQQTTDPYTSVASGLVVGVEASSSSGTSSHQTFSSSSDNPSTAGQTTSTSSRADVPVKLQFGLFSGPSLIPSPVPAIQIGSIQMPLHVHPPVGSSVAHVHPSQPPIFQFGQLRYTSPISQGILPMAPQSMSFVQPNVQPHYNLTQNGGSLVVQPAQDPSKRTPMKEDMQSFALSKPPNLTSGPLDQPREDVSQTLDSSLAKESVETIFKKAPGTVGNKISSKLASQGENEGQAIQAPNLSIPGDKNFGGLKAQGQAYSSKGRRFAYTIKNSSVRSKFSAPDSNSLQRRPRRTEFRIRENGVKKQLSDSVSTSPSALEEKSNFSGRGSAIIARPGSKRDAISSKASKAIVDSRNAASADINSQEVDSGTRVGKEIWKNALSKSLNPTSAEGNLKRNISEEDVDAPLQSGVVRVFKQSGIEAPSDEDDFIQVRSKRQMLNDRREQREKELKAKSRLIKPPRKSRASRQSHGGPSSLHKIFAPVDAALQNVNSDYVASKGCGAATKEVSTGKPSQPLAPIGTPAVTPEPQANMKSHAHMSLPVSAASIVSSAGKDVTAAVMFDSKDKVADDAPVSSRTSWGTTQISQQVMVLTQNQLEEAMKPVRFDTHITAVGGSSTVTEPALPSSSILMKDKSFPSSASPINSLLAGEKIQFGAVTSPTVLPPSGRVVSHGIGVSSSIQSDMQIPHNLSAVETALFYEKDKDNSDSNDLQDSEAEAEAAASAVAVAAISTDDTVGNEVASVTVSGNKSFVGAGMAADQQLSSQSRAEEHLIVSLPADLSVETPPISLWPPLPSPQGSSNQVLSHFPGGPSSHFPFYEMNPLSGAPVFAFGPHDDAASNQSQSQKNTPCSSGPPSSWQHPMVDSFYGPPAGFTGSFITPPGGIPGVQGPPHMVVYNHFTPVGQFGQVGLSYMGTTYIPSGKQLDWKHNPTSSSMGMGEGELKNLKITSSQHSSSHIPAPIQHLAPGSPLLRMASPVTMFDVSPFQSSPEMTVQARWPHVPAPPPLQSIHSSRPLQQQGEGVLTLQFAHGQPADQSLDANKFPESQTSTSSINGPGFSVVADTSINRFPDDLGLRGGSSSSTAVGASTHSVVSHSSSENATADTGTNESVRDTMKNNNKGQNNGSFRSHSSSQHRSASTQQSHSAGYSYQRGSGSSQRNASGSDWSYRRTGYHNRIQSNNSDKAFPSAKVKQIYVAKQTRSET